MICGDIDGELVETSEGGDWRDMLRLGWSYGCVCGGGAWQQLSQTTTGGHLTMLQR